jgi:hypothetical protein
MAFESPQVPSGRGVLVRGALASLLPLLACAAALGPAAGVADAHAVHFAGRTIEAPGSWPVYRLSQHPGMCVRLDRRAVYLGRPSTNQRCPAGAIGRRRAILVEPHSASARVQRVPSSALRAAPAAGNVFTGLGFDACSAPSTRTMSAWRSSPYRGIGVYIGGVNRACSQPNLTPEWVAAETSAGWHLMPLYVGAQAPTSSCSSCAKLSASQASAQGSAAAVDAVARATEVAIGPGSPIYFDMESYSRTSAATAATLAFLEAWTVKLHALGYLSGVYSSSASGIADLAAAIGSGYREPDELWTANWNGQQNTLDPVVPASAWAAHQRIHQYRGGHDESYGGATINIDNNYVDAATVGSALPGDENPVGSLNLIGSPGPGLIRAKGWAFDPSVPTAPLAIRLAVGGQTGERGALSYEMGAVATLPRPVVAAQYPQAGTQHGFDTRLFTIRSGRQRVCAYALGLAPGAERLLGCRTTSIPPGVSISNLAASRRAVHLRVGCRWPTGTECPAQIILRAHFRVPVRHYSGHGPRTRPVTRVLGRGAFRLAGGGAHGFRVPFTAGGRAVLELRGPVKTQVVVAIPGSRRVGVLELGG